ncbi:MAG TPA: hypothetical protein VFV10_03260 [Gammaproteobacteria bacterium]|nr:hypothetical protein [Gammaproteobacteria bacterium]
MLAFAVSAPAAADGLLAHYEVTVRDAKDVKVVRSAPAVVLGKAIEHDLGSYRLSLLIEGAEADAYVLTVSLLPAGALGAPIVKESFNGRLAGPTVGPLEFKLERNGVEVLGAMTLALVRP